MYLLHVTRIPLTPAAHFMFADEIFEIASHFVKMGVDKIMLTGGEPTVRKDFNQIIERLSNLPTKLALTTNGLTIHRHIDVLKKADVDVINISIDSLNREKFKKITLRDQYERSKKYESFRCSRFSFKAQCCFAEGINDDEIIAFINLSKDRNWQIRLSSLCPLMATIGTGQDCVIGSDTKDSGKSLWFKPN